MTTADKTKTDKTKIFRAYDIRGIYQSELDDSDAFKIGSAFATFNLGRIVVGSDSRLSSPPLKKKLIEGLRSAGSDVVDIGMVATPMVVFAIKHLQCDGGVMVSASHNPKEFNGFKFYDKDAVAISFESGIKDIKDIFESERFSKGSGELITADMREDYANYLLGKLNFREPVRLRIVVDTGNSSPGLVYPYVLKKLGAEVHELFAEPDGNFPNHQPDPSKPENVAALKKKVLEVGADFGFAYDGDGDRLVVIDEKRQTVYVGTVFSILIKSLLEKKPESKVVFTILDSQAIEDTIRNCGGIPVLCRVGHTYLTRKMVEEDAALAGEISGHYYFDETHKSDDALFATLKLIEYITKHGKKISEFAHEFPRYFSEVSEKMRFPVKESEKFSFIENLKNEMIAQGYNVNIMDGTKIFFDDGWALFRPSNTEAVISIAYEAKTKEGFEKVKKFVDGVIEKIPK